MLGVGAGGAALVGGFEALFCAVSVAGEAIWFVFVGLWDVGFGWMERL